MSNIDQQGSSLGSFRPPFSFIPTLIGLRAFYLVSSLVWWETLANIGALFPALAVGSPARLHGCAALKHGLALAIDSLVRLSTILVHTNLDVDQHQLLEPNVQLHLPRRRPASTSRTKRPAAHIYDSTNINYLQRSTSCFSWISTIPATDTNQLIEDTTYHELYALVKASINCHLCYICYLAFVSFIVS